MTAINVAKVFAYARANLWIRQHRLNDHQVTDAMVKEAITFLNWVTITYDEDRLLMDAALIRNGQVQNMDDSPFRRIVDAISYNLGFMSDFRDHCYWRELLVAAEELLEAEHGLHEEP